MGGKRIVTNQRGNRQMKKKYYFIIFESEYTGKRSGITQKWSRHERIIKQHPIDYLMLQRTKHSETEYARYRYRLLFWSEIPVEVAIRNQEEFE